jgi:hypothetical protein
MSSRTAPASPPGLRYGSTTLPSGEEDSTKRCEGAIVRGCGDASGRATRPPAWAAGRAGQLRGERSRVETVRCFECSRSCSRLGRQLELLVWCRGSRPPARPGDSLSVSAWLFRNATPAAAFNRSLWQDAYSSSGFQPGSRKIRVGLRLSHLLDRSFMQTCRSTDRQKQQAGTPVWSSPEPCDCGSSCELKAAIVMPLEQHGRASVARAVASAIAVDRLQPPTPA